MLVSGRGVTPQSTSAFRLKPLPVVQPTYGGNAMQHLQRYEDMVSPAGTPRPHINQGPQITERLEQLLQINRQQRRHRLHHAQRPLAPLQPEPDRVTHNASLSAEPTHT